MRIAHLVCRFPPYTGGMGQVAFEQVNRLAKRGHQLTVFTLSQKKILNPRQLNFQVRYLSAFPRLGNAGFCPQILWQLKEFDLIQLHYPFYGLQELLWLGKKLGLIKGRLIIFYHMDASFGSWLLEILSFKSRLIKNSLFNMAERVCCASLDYLKHSSLAKFYHQHRDKIVEIPFGSNQTGQLIQADKLLAFKNDLGIKSGEKVVLFVGGLDPAHYFKGVPVLIEAIHKLKNSRIKLVIVGDGNLRDDFERQTKGLGLVGQVFFAGRVNSSELPYYYAAADVIVLPSTTKAEAFGLVLVEAKTFGKPVIGSDLPGVRDVVGGSGLTAKPGDANELAEKIETILTDQTLADKFSRLALQEVKEKYNWDKHVSCLEQVYQQVC